MDCLADSNENDVMTGQVIVYGVLLLALALFVWGKWRYDVIALLALLTLTIAGVVPGASAFAGFGHPAVVTVAAVLAVSRGLENSGLVDLLTRWMSRVGHHPTIQLAALTALVTVCSAFMNNVGALALLMPVAIRMARRSGHAPSLLLMPLAFGSLLGGMTTLIGTPPNIIIANYRAETGAGPFSMFDFSPVGMGLAVVGVAFIVLVGWRLIPHRQNPASAQELFQVGEYLSEVQVPEGSKLIGKTVHHLETSTESEVTVLGIIRNDRRLLGPSTFEILRADDTLIVAADPEDLQKMLEASGMTLVAERPKFELLGSEEIRLVEAIVTPASSMPGKTVVKLGLRWRHGINLVAVARQGQSLKQRLKQIKFAVGDILLLQGPDTALQEALPALGCLPLAERQLKLGYSRRVFLAVLLFALGLGAAAMGWLPVHVAFVGVTMLMLLVGLLSLRDAYASVNWPIVVLLGAMLPVGQALETTGGADFIASQMLIWGRSLPPVMTLALVLIGTMFLSDLINNAAAAVLVAPIAISLAQGLGVSADPFLMCVAIGASCAFLTPIGHQSNTLVMVPGGYRFGDYWRMGLPLEILIVAVGLPLIIWRWPFHPGQP